MMIRQPCPRVRHVVSKHLAFAGKGFKLLCSPQQHVSFENGSSGYSGHCGSSPNSLKAPGARSAKATSTRNLESWGIGLYGLEVL